MPRHTPSEAAPETGAETAPGDDAAERLGGLLRRHDVDQHAGAALEPGLGDEVRPQVDVPVVLAGVLVRRAVHAEVERHVAERRVGCRGRLPEPLLKFVGIELVHLTLGERKIPFGQKQPLQGRAGLEFYLDHFVL